MKIWAIARNTLQGLLRNKVIILFVAIFLCVLLLMTSPILFVRAEARTHSASYAEGMVLGLVGFIMTMVSGFGSLLAAWSAADAVAGEMRSGTVLAVMARPVRRWEFLLGKYLGVQLLMAVYVVAMLGFSYLLAWIGGQRIHAAAWVLIVYPLARYAIYSAIAVLLVTRMHPIVGFGIVMVISVLAMLAAPGARSFLPEYVHTGLYYLLPSTELLSESRFLTLTQSALKPVSWSEHAITLAYGLDYAAVLFLLAAWSFRRNSLSRD
jgi:ABC-type transport system involved in multi-copper enzyme maturation permease subunit